MNKELKDAFEALAALGSQLKVLGEVVEERRRQMVDLDYPPEHDDQHEFEEFAWIIKSYTDKIESVNQPHVEGEDYITEEKIREWFIKITAVALAAVESMDRRNAKSDD